MHWPGKFLADLPDGKAEITHPSDFSNRAS